MINSFLSDHKLVDKFPLVLMRNLNQGISILKNKKLMIRIVFISSQMIDDPALPLIRNLMIENPGIPFVLVKNSEGEMTFTNDQNLFGKVIDRPASYGDLVDFSLKHFEAQNDWGEIKDGEGEKFEEVSLEDSKYLAIPLGEYLNVKKSYLNLYIKVGKSRFVKIVNAGDELVENFLDHWIEKGVLRFFVSGEEHLKYLKFVGNLNQKIIQNEQIENQAKLQNILKYGFQISRNMAHFGIGQSQMDEAINFIEGSLQIIRSMRIKDEKFTKYLESIKKSEHISSVAFIAGLIATEMGISSKKTTTMVGITALLHDFGFFDLMPDFLEHKENELLDSHPEYYEIHAKHGADLLRTQGNFDEAICLGIEQHHQRRKGDNKTARSSTINIMSEIVSVADEFFNHLVSNDATDVTSKLMDLKVLSFKENQLKNFSQNVEKAFNKVFPSK